MAKQITLYANRKFSAAHFLPAYEGKCAKLHGHTWRTEVWVKGPINLDTGMVADFADIKTVIDKFDHTCLNEIGFDNPTAEHLALYFFTHIPNCIKIRVWESENCYAEISTE